MYLNRGLTNMPLVVKNLIIINALFFLARYTLASTLNIDLNSVLGSIITTLQSLILTN